MCNYSRDDYMDDKDFYKNEYNEYDDYDDNDDDDNFIIFNNYDELMYLTNYTKTDDKVRDILYGLIKYININKKKVRFTFDYTIKPKHEWLHIAKEFKSNIEGGDYLILIDEEAIVCYQ